MAKIELVRGMCPTDMTQISLHAEGNSSENGSMAGISRRKNPTKADSSSEITVIEGLTFMGAGLMPSIIEKA
jgi:hypothetical protein